MKIEIINTLLRIPAEPGETIWVEDEETMRANFDKLPRGCPRPRLNFDEFLRAAERGRGRDKGTAHSDFGRLKKGLEEIMTDWLLR